MVMNIGARTYIAGEGTVCFVAGNGMVEDPALRSVVPPEPVFHRKFASGIERVDIDADASSHVLRMNVVHPSVSDFLLQAPADEL